MADLDVPPAGFAALAGQEGWDGVLVAVADSVRACVLRLDPADRRDLDAGRRTEAILAGLREAAVADAAHRIIDTHRTAPVLALWRGLAVLRPPPPGIDTGWASPVDRSGPRWARVREDLVEAIDRIARHQLAVRFPPEGLLIDVDRDPVAAGDDVTGHRERWTLDPGATVDGVLLALVRGYTRAHVHRGASWLVELRSGRRTTPLAVVIDHDRSGDRATEVLSLLPRVAGRPLVEVAAPYPGERVEIYLRYLVNSRLQTPDQLAAERTVAGAQPRLVVKDD